MKRLPSEKFCVGDRVVLIDDLRAADITGTCVTREMERASGACAVIKEVLETRADSYMLRFEGSWSHNPYWYSCFWYGELLLHESDVSLIPVDNSEWELILLG